MRDAMTNKDEETKEEHDCDSSYSTPPASIGGQSNESYETTEVWLMNSLLPPCRLVSSSSMPSLSLLFGDNDAKIVSNRNNNNNNNKRVMMNRSASYNCLFRFSSFSETESQQLNNEQEQDDDYNDNDDNNENRVNVCYNIFTSYVLPVFLLLQWIPEVYYNDYKYYYDYDHIDDTMGPVMAIWIILAIVFVFCFLTPSYYQKVVEKDGYRGTIRKALRLIYPLFLLLVVEGLVLFHQTLLAMLVMSCGLLRMAVPVVYHDCCRSRDQPDGQITELLLAADDLYDDELI